MLEDYEHREPETDDEFIDAIEKSGYEFIDHGDTFSIRSKNGGSTRLEATELSDALYEAWNLVKEE